MKIKNIQDVVLPMAGSAVSVVFVSGVTGQDGSHMVDYLLKNVPNTFIIGGARRLSVDNHQNIDHLSNEQRFQLVNFDLTDSHSIYKLMEHAKPDYFINFAAQSFVASSWDFARQTWQTNSTSILDCLEAIKRLKPECRFYNAGSSEEFGNVLFSPQNETHPPHPRSPYGASKAAARTLIKVYRESYGLYAVQGWLFNHEGTRRGEQFVTRKITKGVARIKKAIDLFNKGVEGISPRELKFDPIELGNINALRDWSDAEDMVDAVWRMLNQEKFACVPWAVNQPTEDFQYAVWHKFVVNRIKDYVVSSDENHSIREFITEAFSVAGIDGMWFINMKNDPLSEHFVYVDGGIPVPDLELVKINPRFYRPAEVEILKGDSSAIRNDLGWNPQSNFKSLVKKMVENDLTHT